jgi:uncharacterized protein YnzC (UPF0291/DUF896 family)
MQPSAEIINRVNEFRRKMADGTITLDEQKEAIILLRQNRFSAQAAASASKKKPSTKKPVKSGDDLLSELDDL